MFSGVGDWWELVLGYMVGSLRGTGSGYRFVTAKEFGIYAVCFGPQGRKTDPVGYSICMFKAAALF